VAKDRHYLPHLVPGVLYFASFEYVTCFSTWFSEVDSEGVVHGFRKLTVKVFEIRDTVFCQMQVETFCFSNIHSWLKLKFQLMLIWRASVVISMLVSIFSLSSVVLT
jgi:hypothetical protein